MCYIRVTEGKIENLKKEGKMRISTLIFIYTIHFAYLKMHTKFHNPKSSTCQPCYVKLAYLEYTAYVEVIIHFRIFPLYYIVIRPCLCQTRLS